MILIEGKKRFYFIPYDEEEKIKDWLGKGPVFTSTGKIAEGRALGL